MIQAEHITHSFGEKKILEDISFTVEKGEVIGLLGPSGAGKTTLVNILTGQLKASGGNVKVLCGDGKTLKTGIMMDSFGLYERLSVWDNLRIFADIYRVSAGRIENLLDRTGLRQARNTMVSKLSKGMRGRVNLCRALLKEVDILYLDEPTSGLDPATTWKIHQLIEEESQSGTTVFLTTHNMHEAEELCDRVMLLNEGKIVEQGTCEDICTRYNTLDEIEVTLKDGEKHVIRNAQESEGVLAEWIRTERILTIHSSEPDMERVFLSITGRRLSD
ncbi:MAG: ABC transporter ATP-binding protein [Lachnospiraceae bacterium]|nr:ABC transporter ATP-binding protein [Lachnospiraceae bacterium]